MKINQKLFLLSFFFSVFIFDAFGQEAEKKASPFRFLIKGGLDSGGDDVAEVDFEDGSKQTLKAGQGASIALGVEYQIPTLKSVLFHGTVGYKYVTTKADNAHIRLTRVPIHITANWMPVKNLRFGAGLASHQGIRYNSDGIGENMTFRSATGPTIELAYSVIGLTYTAMSYKDQLNRKYSANALGVAITLAFPKR